MASTEGKPAVEGRNIIDFPVYKRQLHPGMTLDHAELATRIRLDNGRHIDVFKPPRYTAGQLDRLPAEILAQILLHSDLPSLTRFRRVNRYAMKFVDSIPQYASIIKHCPDIIRAILSIEADAFDCRALYMTLSTSRCSTCERFGGDLYLITCRRVCLFCLTCRSDYLPLLHIYQRPPKENVPSVLSRPGRYSRSTERDPEDRRLRLVDRESLSRIRTRYKPELREKPGWEPERFMAIITAPYLFDSGLPAEWGYFCLGCWLEKEGKEKKDFRIKYTRQEILEHVARYGPVEETPGPPLGKRHVSEGGRAGGR